MDMGSIWEAFMPKLCGAKCKCNPRTLAFLERYGSEAVSSYLRRNRCRQRVAIGRKRCRFHGGLSTGAKTVEGKRRAIAAMQAGNRAARLAGRYWKPGPPKGYRRMTAVSPL